MRFGTRISLSLALTATLSLSFSGWIAYTAAADRLEEQVKSRLLNLAHVKNRVLQEWLASHQRLISLEARQISSMALRSDQEETLQSNARLRFFLNSVVEESDGFGELSLLSGDQGQVVVSSDRYRVGTSRREAEHWQAGRKQAFLSTVEWNPQRLRPVSYAAAPVVIDHTLFVLAGLIDWWAFNPVSAETAELQPIRRVLLTDRNGLYLNQPHAPGELVASAFNASRFVRQCSAGNQVGRYQDAQGEDVLGARIWSADYGYCLTVEQPLAYALAPIGKLVEALTFGLVMVLVVAVVLGFAFGRRLARPLTELKTVIGQIEQGAIEKRIALRADDEFNDLADAFNRMMDNLHRVTASRDALDAEVELRRQSQLKLAEALADLRKQKSKLERSNRDLEQFAYVASHDLQEPLRMVANFTSLLEQRYKGQLDDKADQFIHFAVDGARRMQGLINDLLQYSRLNTQAKRYEAVALADLIEGVKHDLSVCIEETGALITTHGKLPVVHAEPAQMRMLFQNLISNALKFRGEAAPQIDLYAETTEEGWKFRLCDNGIGIDPAYAERIFVIFQRLHTHDQYPGSGLGLALVKRIVERHGGSIGVQPNSPTGTCFEFTLTSHVIEEHTDA